jgi:hypothetical protein
MLVSTACTCTNTKTPVLCTSGSGMLRTRATSRVARLSIHGITLAAIEKLLGRVGVLMVISCDVKMIRSDTQFDYVRGNVNETVDENAGCAVGFIGKINVEKISWDGRKY